MQSQNPFIPSELKLRYLKTENGKLTFMMSTDTKKAVPTVPGGNYYKFDFPITKIYIRPYLEN